VTAFSTTSVTGCLSTGTVDAPWAPTGIGGVMVTPGIGPGDGGAQRVRAFRRLAAGQASSKGDSISSNYSTSST
jgi:hypothetical protein